MGVALLTTTCLAASMVRAGYCLAGGSELAAACDIVLVADDSKIGYPVRAPRPVASTAELLSHRDPMRPDRLPPFPVQAIRACRCNTQCVPLPPLSARAAFFGGGAVWAAPAVWATPATH